MNNTKVKEIIKFSFYKSIKNKWFIVFNLITLLTTVLVINWNNISNIFKIDEESRLFEIAILDNSNMIYDDFANNFSKNTDYNIVKITENHYTAENIPDNFVIIEIKPDEQETFLTTIISKEGIDANIYNLIKGELTDIRNNLLAKKYELSIDDLNLLQRDLNIERIMLSVDVDNSNTKEFLKLFSAAATYIIAVFIFSKLAGEISQEKQSKSTEYVLTTVLAKEYLFAKIFANIAILLIQGLLLLTYYFIAALFSNIITTATTDISLNSALISDVISLDVVLYICVLLIYNILNLILLCIILAFLASKTSSNSEANNTVSIVTLIMMFAYIATIYFITPYAKANILLYIISCLPILSAYFIPAMMVVGQANVLQIVISLIILIISIPFSFNLVAKHFKNGILDYKKQKIREIKDEKDLCLTKKKMKNIGFVVGTAIIIYVGVQMIVSLLGSFALPAIFENHVTQTDITLILQMILQITSLGLASWFVLTYVDKNDARNSKKNITVHQKIKIIFIAVMAIFALQFLLSLVIYPAIGLDYNTSELIDVNNESSLFSKIIFVIAIAVIPAIFEELFFRKSIIDLTCKHSKKFALLFSSILFGLLHMNLSQGLFAFIIGIILGLIYLYTKDIKLTMFIHFVNNGFAALEMILPETGAIIIVGILLLCLIVGVVLFIKILLNKESRNKVVSLCKINVSLNSIRDKYIYILSDYCFIVSMTLVVLMSIMTENMLR